MSILTASTLPDNHFAPIAKEYRRAFQNFYGRLSDCQLLGKGVVVALGWSELLPLKADILDQLAEQRHLLKTVNSTFALPKFFKKQIKFAQAFVHLKEDLVNGSDFDNLLKDVKKLFFASLDLTISSMRLSLLLDKTNLISLGKFSRKLPYHLKSGVRFLSFGLVEMQFIDNAWIFGLYLHKKHSKGADFKEIFSSTKGRNLTFKLVSCAIKTSLAFLEAATLLAGYYPSPLFLMSTSTLSFATSLFDRILRVNSYPKDVKAIIH